MQNLKPCPFCGSDDIRIDEMDEDGDWFDKVECTNCLVEGWGWTAEDWNKRAGESSNDK